MIPYKSLDDEAEEEKSVSILTPDTRPIVKKRKIDICDDCNDSNNFLKELKDDLVNPRHKQVPWSLTLKFEKIEQILPEVNVVEPTTNNIYLLPKPVGVNPQFVALLATLFALSAMLNINLIKRLTAVKRSHAQSHEGDDKMESERELREQEELEAAEIARKYEKQEFLRARRAFEEEEAQEAKKIKDASDEFVALAAAKRKADELERARHLDEEALETERIAAASKEFELLAAAKRQADKDAKQRHLEEELREAKRIKDASDEFVILATAKRKTDDEAKLRQLEEKRY